MEKTWKEYYEDLTEFIANNPENIRISTTSVSVDSSVKDEFNTICHSVRKAFVDDYFTDDYKMAIEFIEHWNQVKNVLEVQYTINSFVENERLNNFIVDIDGYLDKQMICPLRDLFKGKITLDDFESTCKNELAKDFYKFNYLLYRYWVVSRLVLFLEPEAIYAGETANSNIDYSALNGVACTFCQMDTKYPREVSGLYFDDAHETGFLISYMIIKSKKFNRLVALRLGYESCKFSTRLYSPNQEWISLHEIDAKYYNVDLWSNLYIYVADDLHDLEILGDHFFICRPNINIDFADIRDLDDELLQSARKHNLVTRPKQGSIIVCKNSCDLAFANLAADSIDANKYLYDRPGYQFITEHHEENQIDTGSVDGVVLAEDNSIPGVADSIDDANNDNRQEISENITADSIDNCIEESEIVDNEDSVELTDMDIKVVEIGWNTTNLEEILAEKIQSVPKVELINW